MKNHIIIRMAIIAIAVTLYGHTYADNKYECDFEDVNEHSAWTLNPGNQGPKCANIWHIGTGEKNGGDYGIYISSDGGTSAVYALNADFTVAYRTLTLDAGTYELSFDYMCGGNINDVLYVGWIPATEPTNCHSQGLRPNWVDTCALRFTDNRQKLYDTDWTSTYCTITSDGTPHKLVLMWNNGEGGVNSPSAAIDNINVIPEGACDRPRKVQFATNGEYVSVTWEGSADSYDFRLRRQGDAAWVEHREYTGNSVTVNGLGEGVYDVYIRSNCGEFHSAWVSKKQFVFYTGTRCIDYMDLEGEHCQCYFGDFLHPDKYPGIIDAGYESIGSRHTLHYDKDETDPRTANRLRTVPKDEIASVRIGNWDVGSEAEMIEYDYPVDLENTAVLLLQYAVVLQDPNHVMENNPRFTLRVIDEEGYDLSEYGCATADFIPGTNTDDDTWETIDSLVWRDWSTMGVNLAEYQGQTLKIQLTSKDCSQSAHFGYAYFALGCSDGQIRALSCGTGDENKFEAPPGFRYRWYRDGTPDVTYSTRQQIAVPQTDTATYWCECIQLTNDNCYFTVSAKAIPRFPHPDMTAESAVEHCQNVVRFTNHSSVILVNPLSGDTTYTDEICDSVHWDFGDGTTSSEWEPVHTFPSEGGTYTVTLWAKLADCEEARTFEISLPQLDRLGDTINATTCYGTPYEFGGNFLFSEGQYFDTVVSQTTGCDSIVTLNLTVHDKYEKYTKDTICSADAPYIFGTQTLYETGSYTEVFKTVWGCDSTVHLDLLVNESLIITLGTENVSVCADDSAIVIPYTLSSGIVTSYDMSVDKPGAEELNIVDGKPEDGSLVIPIPSSVMPDRYTATFRFENMECGDEEKSVTLDINYPDTIIVQRWNDVLGVRNSAYNGGYDFVAYQWYKDGTPLTGEVSANLYQPDGLDTRAQYHVQLTRADGSVANTCPVTPEKFAKIEVFPTVTFTGGNISVKSSATGVTRIWSVTGQLVSVTEITTGVNRVESPRAEGTYIVETTLADGTRAAEKIIVKRQM